MSWSCFHIYYGEPQDKLLSEAVGPIIAELQGNGLQSWFFLRYWMGGPHIRLRFWLEGTRRKEQQEELRLRLSDYVDCNPSPLLDVHSEEAQRAYASLAKLERVAAAEATQTIVQNCVQAATYEPEYAKYGGEAGVAIAEQLFEKSSDIALMVVANGKTRRARLGQAFEMMLAGILAAGLDGAACGEFLAELCAFWSRYVSQPMRERWEHELETNVPVLAKQVESLFSRSFERAPEGAPVQRWASAVRVALSSVDKDASEILPQVSVSPGRPGHARGREFLLMNYLHTHNNRLGIIPAYESYLAYLGHHAVSRCLGRPPTAFEAYVAKQNVEQSEQPKVKS